MELKPILKKLGSIIRAILTFLFALLVLGVMVWAYVEGFQLVTSMYGIISFGFYGLLLSLHVLVQSLFAFIEHRRMRAYSKPCTFTKKIGFTISAFQEDPAYLRECLNSVRALRYPPELLRIIMVVDGNSDDDRYMMDMFREVFMDQDPGFYVWKNNYHTWDPMQAQQDVEMASEMGPGGGC
ncbi:hyaluronan synthase 1 [Lates japonicus]